MDGVVKRGEFGVFDKGLLIDVKLSDRLQALYLTTAFLTRDLEGLDGHTSQICEKGIRENLLENGEPISVIRLDVLV